MCPFKKLFICLLSVICIMFIADRYPLSADTEGTPQWGGPEDWNDWEYYDDWDEWDEEEFWEYREMVLMMTGVDIAEGRSRILPLRLSGKIKFDLSRTEQEPAHTATDDRLNSFSSRFGGFHIGAGYTLPDSDNNQFGHEDTIDDAVFTGPILSFGRIGKVPTLVFFDNSGAAVGSVNAQQAKSDPERTYTILQQAEYNSRYYVSRSPYGSSSLDLNSISPRISFSYGADTEVQQRNVFTDSLGGQTRVRLQLDTSFAGSDRLRTRLNDRSGETNGNRPVNLQVSYGGFNVGGFYAVKKDNWNRSGLTLSSDHVIEDDDDELDWAFYEQRLSDFNAISTIKSPYYSEILLSEYNGQHFDPAANLALHLGQNKSDLQLTVDMLNNNFNLRFGSGENFFQTNRGCQPTMLEEEDRDEYPTAPKEPEADIQPNDPLYKKVKRKKKAFLGIFGGGGPEISGGILSPGSGVSVGRRSEKSEIHDQWGLEGIGYSAMADPDSAWHAVDSSKRNVVVAVIDSGLDRSHPDGPKHVWVNSAEVPDNGIDDDGNGYIDDINGWNFHHNNNDLTDYIGHGTFVAGIIAARSDNGEGIAGINPGAVIMPLKINGKKKPAASLNVFRAIKYAVNQGADVINISYGAPGVSSLEQIAMNYARARGVLVVVASGNTGDYIKDQGPAGNRRVFSVGSLDFEGTRSTISSWGPNNALLAPGEEIYSLHSKDAPRMGGSADRERMYYRASGTSFSAPMVTATASLLLSQNPDLSPTQLEDILISTADRMGKEVWDDKNGAGRLNAARALRYKREDIFNVMVTDLRVNETEKKKLDSVDVFATVRGSLKEFIVELGKGKRPGRFKPVTSAYTRQANDDWVAHITKEDLKGSKDWTVRIRALDQTGIEHNAQTLLELM